MYYGIQLAASGALTNLYKTDVFANNLANLNTAGFKPDLAYARQRDVARVEDGLWGVPSNELLEKLGAGVHMAPNAIDFTQGDLMTTSNELDLAVRGEGFFVLRNAADGANAGVQLTRDGRFTRDASGRLVSATTGLPATSVRNRPIVLDPSLPVEIDNQGRVTQAGAEVDRIQLISIEDRELLKKAGKGAFSIPSAALGQSVPATGLIEQGMLEGSAVDPISAMMAVQSAARSVGTNISMISYQDRMMERAINTFARVG